MPKLLHRQVFTHRHRGSYTKVLHTDAADASTHRSFWTQMPFHTKACTQRRFDIYTPMHTEAFRHRLFFRESQKLWPREAFTQRIFYTQKLLHTHKLFHRSFYTEKLLSTGAFTHRRLYTQKLVHGGFYAQKLLHLLHREAFTHRRFPAEKPIPQSSFYTLQKIAILRKFLASGHHMVRKGCIRRWKITIFDVGQSFCVKWLRLTL